MIRYISYILCRSDQLTENVIDLQVTDELFDLVLNVPLEEVSNLNRFSTKDHVVEQIEE